MVRRLSKEIAALLLALGLGVAAFGQTLSGTTLTVSGAEQSSGGVYDSGSITVTVNGYVKTLSGVRGYGQYSDVGSVASLIAVHLSEDTSAPVWAKSVGPVITMVGRAGQPVTVSATTGYDTAHFGGPSFTFSSGSTTVTPTPFLSLHCTRSTMGTSDKANCVAAIEGTSTLYGAPAATSSMAFTINSASWTSAPVGTDGTATAMGLSESSTGTYTVRADYPGDSYYSAMHATATITVGSTPSLMNIYSYFITGPGGSGYDSASNIIAYSDSVNGQWTFGYDGLNRLQAASSSPAIKPSTPYMCWSYDSFGNRKQQYFGSSAFSGGGASACSGGGSTTATQDQYYGSNNQLTSDTTISTSFGYDLAGIAGNMTNDGSGGHQYAYDQENRVCAMSITISSTTAYWGYLYDAQGRRVAKGRISSLDCSLVASDSFTVSEAYILGPDGATMTVLDGSGGWKHTDVPAGPGTMAVYDGDGLHFRFADWLGTHRVQTDYQGTTPVEESYQGLPFGEMLGSDTGATEKYFTGKERDTESGLDYFGARYYASSMGRWTSPDSVNVTEDRLISPSSSLNKYDYAANNPLKYIDPDGQDITYFYDQTGFAGHAVLFAYNQANGDSAIESFGPASRSIGTRIEEAGLFQVPGMSMFDMNVPKTADELRGTYSALTIQTSPELTQQVINYIRQNPDPATWGVLGPNCSSQVWKILRQLKIAHATIVGGKTPKIVWQDLYMQNVKRWQVRIPNPSTGKDYGHPRCGVNSCMFDLMWNSLPQSHEKVIVIIKGTDGKEIQ